MKSDEKVRKQIHSNLIEFFYECVVRKIERYEEGAGGLYLTIH